MDVFELHCHSTASDGSLSPAALVEYAAARGMTTLALTDHDTLDGLAEAAKATEQHSIRLIAGTEISVKAPTGSMHLLAYLPSLAPEPLQARMQAIGDYRGTRNERIVARLCELGYPIEWADVARRAKGRVGRPHIAATLLDAGHVATIQEAFDELLADGKPAYVDAGSLGPLEAVKLVCESGGLAVLAHPYTLRLADAALARFVAELVDAGLAGIECHRPDHDASERARTLKLAQAHDLLALGGSDWHGRPSDPALGSSGETSVSNEALEALLSISRTSS